MAFAFLGKGVSLLRLTAVRGLEMSGSSSEANSRVLLRAGERQSYTRHGGALRSVRLHSDRAAIGVALVDTFSGSQSRERCDAAAVSVYAHAPAINHNIVLPSSRRDAADSNATD